MPSVAKILEKEGDKIVSDLIEKYDQLGMRASGNWARQLESEVVETKTGVSLRIVGTSYTEFLVNGRRPGKFPPVNEIIKWIRQKNISVQGITIGSLAYLIGRKIAEKGTKYFQEGGTDLINSVLKDSRINVIIEEISIPIIEDFTDIYVNNF